MARRLRREEGLEGGRLCTPQGFAFIVSDTNEAKRPTRTYADNFPMFDPAHAVLDHPAAIEVDMVKALSDPAAVFASPRDVLKHAALSRRAKLDILRRWAWIARRTDIAAPDASHLAQVLEALVRRFGAGSHQSGKSPTGGHP